METGKIFNIQHFSIGDGPGIRTTVFMKGCNLRCAWCHNPESQSKNTEMIFHTDKCIGCNACMRVCPNQLKDCIQCGKCVSACGQEARELCGKEYTVNQVLEEILEDRPFYDFSEGGVTFSGGECMLQVDFICKILEQCKKNAISTAIDTAGLVPWESFEKVLPYTDVFLYDIKTMCNEIHKKYTGVGNVLILENLKRLLKSGTRVWIRIPLVCGVNDTKEDMENIKAFFDVYGYPEKTDLLPYHAVGEYKYLSLGKTFVSFKAPDEEKTEMLKNIIKSDSEYHTTKIDQIIQ